MTPLQWFRIFSSLGYVLFTSVTSTLTLLVPAVVLLRPLSSRLYARATSSIFAAWWTSCLFITERLNGVSVRVTGDELPLNVPLLIMSNHKCNLDWMFLWSCAVRTGSLFHVGVFRAVAKREIRTIPIFGWGCKLNGFAYVRRAWDRDVGHLTRWAGAQMRRRAPGWVLIFPEGTRYTDANKARSDAARRREGASELPGEILRPRTKGLALLLGENERHQYFGKVVDMTIQYTDASGAPLAGSQLGTRCFGQLAKGELPVATCHVHFETFDARDVPVEPEEVARWCEIRWRRKAEMLAGLARPGAVGYPGAKEWASSGGAVPFAKQTALRILFTLQGLACVGCLARSSAFAAYAVAAFAGLAGMCYLDPPWW